MLIVVAVAAARRRLCRREQLPHLYSGGIDWPSDAFEIRMRMMTKRMTSVFLGRRLFDVAAAAAAAAAVYAVVEFAVIDCNKLLAVPIVMTEYEVD